MNLEAHPTIHGQVGGGFFTHPGLVPRPEVPPEVPEFLAQKGCLVVVYLPLRKI